LNYFKVNFSYIKKYKSYLIKDFENSKDKEIKFFISKNVDNFLNAKINGITLHSRNIKREIDNALKNIQKAQVYIFLGLGCAHYIKEFLKINKDETKIFIIQKDAFLLKKLIEEIDLKYILTNTRIELLFENNIDILFDKLSSYSLISLIKLNSELQIDEFFFKELQIKINELVQRKNINLNTLKKFSKLWSRNLIKNHNYLLKYPGVDLTKNYFKGVPVLIIGAGPSIDDLDNIVKLKNKLLIIAVDTAYSFCLNKGIEPDFIVVTDAQYWNTKHIQRVKNINSIIITELSCQNKIFNIFKNNAIMLNSSLFPLGKYLEKTLKKRHHLLSGGSVLTTAFSYAKFLNAKEIYISGLDLSFPNHKTHYHGSYFEQNLFNEVNIFNTVNNFNINYINSGMLYFVKNNDDKMILSDRRMEVYLNWFKSELKLTKDKNIYNLSKYGVKIDNMVYYNHNNLLKLKDIREDIDNRLTNLKSEINNYKIDYNIEFRNNIKEFRNNLDFLYKNITVLLNNIDNKNNYNLKEIEDKISNKLNNNIISFILQKEIQDFLLSNEDINIKTSQLYQQIKKSVLYYIEILNKEEN